MLWLDSITRKVALMCGKFGPIPSGVLSVLSPILVEISTSELARMRNLDGWGSW